MLFSFPLRYLCSISFSLFYLALGVAYPLYLGIDLKIPDSLEQPETFLPWKKSTGLAPFLVHDTSCLQFFQDAKA